MRCSILAVLDMTHGKCHAKNDMTEGNRKIGTFNKLKEEEEIRELAEVLEANGQRGRLTPAIMKAFTACNREAFTACNMTKIKYFSGCNVQSRLRGSSGEFGPEGRPASS